MCKGWPGVVGLYEYKIELVNRKDRTKKTCREHMSEFEATISWGYNRFIKLDALEKENYLDSEEDLLEFRYYIYPSSEFQLITDLNRYIESLEDNNKQVSSV
jgi:MATH domain